MQYVLLPLIDEAGWNKLRKPAHEQEMAAYGAFVQAPKQPATSRQRSERTGGVQQAKASAQSPRETFEPATMKRVGLLL